MINSQFLLKNEQATIEFAKCFADCIKQPMTVTFQGNIGTGKTTFIRAMLKALGVKETIKSPTFSIVETYHTDRLPIHHFDLYRIQDDVELDYIGFRDYFNDGALCCIEWPERAPMSVTHLDVKCSLSIEGSGRALHIHALTTVGEDVLACVREK